MKYKICSITNKGKRRTNEDRYAFLCSETEREKVLIALIADGMGGCERGEAAAEIIRRCMISFFDGEKLRKGSFSPLLKSFIAEANSRINRYMEKEGVFCGSTLALLLLSSKGYFITENVGDSAIYRIGKGEVFKLTKDQTVFEYELESGETFPLAPEKKKHTLMQCMGAGESPLPEEGRGTYERGDKFLLCSDGLSNLLEEEDMKRFFGGEFSSGCLPAALLHVRKKGEGDNATGILIGVR